MLSNIYLTNFRNFNEAKFDFSGGTTVILGENGTGKTNILESIFLLATGKSFKARIEEEMINFNEDLSRIKADLTNGEERKLEIVLTRGKIDIGESKIEKVTRKKLLVNGISRRLLDFAGNLKVVLFNPWDLDLISGSPSGRRNFLDDVLSQIDYEYRRASLSYDKGLRQRNRLLFRIREEGVSRSQLLFWNKLLVRNGDYISRRREEIVNFINQSKPINNEIFQLIYDKSPISETRIEQYKDEEIAAATTLVGPHRDDIIFQKKGEEFKDLARYGSRGEQRMCILWTKLAQLEFIKNIVGKLPLLLLDDIFSELDHEHREIVIKTANNQQTIITTADPHFVEGIEAQKIQLGFS